MINQTTEAANDPLMKQAEKIFPIVFPEQALSVQHARDAWVKAKQYLEEKNISIKPVIKIKPEVDNVLKFNAKSAK